MKNYEKNKSDLIRHLKKYSIKTGDFTLKSGEKSEWFCDSKQSACRPEGIKLIANMAIELIPEGATAIGGLAAGADPIAFGVAAIATERGRDLNAFSIRKETKEHGIAGRLAGVLEPNDTAIIVEDTVTRGVSALEAAKVVKQLGAEPMMIMSIVDRGGVCDKLAGEHNLKFHTLVTAPELGFDYDPKHL